MTLFKGSRAPIQHKSALLLPSLSYTILQNKSLNLLYPQFIHFLAVQLIHLCQSMYAWVLTHGPTVQTCRHVEAKGRHQASSSIALGLSFETGSLSEAC